MRFRIKKNKKLIPSLLVSLIWLVSIHCVEESSSKQRRIPLKEQAAQEKEVPSTATPEIPDLSNNSSNSAAPAPTERGVDHPIQEIGTLDHDGYQEKLKFGDFIDLTESTIQDSHAISHRIASNQSGTTALAWKQQETSNGQSVEVLYSRTSEDGLKWQAPVRIDRSDVHKFQDFNIVVSADGEILAIWLEQVLANRFLYFAVYDTAKSMWINHTKISDSAVVNAAVGYSLLTESFWVAWNSGDYPSIALSLTSISKSGTVNRTIKLVSDEGKINSVPVIAFNKDGLGVVAWDSFDTKSSPRYSVKAAILAQKEWGAPIEISDQYSHTDAEQSHQVVSTAIPDIGLDVSDSGLAIIAWEVSFVPYKADQFIPQEIWVRTINASGTGSKPIRVSDNKERAQFPIVKFADPNQAVVVYRSENQQNNNILKASYYNMSGAQFSAVRDLSSLQENAWYPSVVGLFDQRILVSFTQSQNAHYVPAAVVYDPKKAIWSETFKISSTDYNKDASYPVVYPRNNGLAGIVWRQMITYDHSNLTSHVLKNSQLEIQRVQSD